MFAIRLHVSEAEKDHLTAELWDAGTSGISEEAGVLRAFFDRPAVGSALLDRFRSYQPQLFEEPETDWVKQFQDSWQPFTVGERLYLVPEWREDPAPCGRVRLKINPGLACGSGTHPATQLCLEALEQYIPEGKPALDVGTGSGILAQAAILLGAAPVYGCDIDHEATLVAKNNFSNMPFSLPLFTGSLRSVRAGSIDLIVANLNAATLRQLAPEINRIAPATTILSGFRISESEAIAKLLATEPRAQLTKDEYACLVI